MLASTVDAIDGFVLFLFGCLVLAVLYAIATGIITLYIQNAKLLKEYFIGRNPHGKFFIYGKVLWVTAAPVKFKVSNRNYKGEHNGYNYELFDDEAKAEKALKNYIESQRRTTDRHENNKKFVTEEVLSDAQAVQFEKNLERLNKELDAMKNGQKH